MKLTTPKNFPIVLANLGQLDETVLQKAAQGLRRGLEFTKTAAQQQYLRGPRPAKLGEVTGRLRQSISYDVQVAGKGVVGRIGSNVKYARFHEFGLIGTVNVRAHARHIENKLKGGPSREAKYRREEVRTNGRTIRTGRIILVSRESVEQAKSRGVEFSAQKVKAHTRRLNYKGRPFIRPALEKTEKLIKASIVKALEGIKP